MIEVLGKHSADNRQKVEKVKVNKYVNPQMTRRRFLVGLTGMFAKKTVESVFPKKVIAALRGKTVANKIRLMRVAKEVEKKFWLDVIENVSKTKGKKITPNDVRSYLITKFLDIPQGWTSSLTTEKKNSGPIKFVKDTKSMPIKFEYNSEWDELINTYFANRSMIIGYENEKPIARSDFREFPNVSIALRELKKYVEKHPDETLKAETYRILQKEFDFYQKVKDNPKITKLPMEFVYLPNGVPVFSVGVYHEDKEFLEEYLQHYLNTYKEAKYVALECLPELPIGESLSYMWNIPEEKRNIFDSLLHKLNSVGFRGYFLELDPRNKSKIFDSYISENDEVLDAKLPEIYYEHYFKYLEREDFNFAKKVGSAKNLKLLLQKQAHLNRIMRESGGEEFPLDNSVDVNLKASPLPTGLEIGNFVFSSAMIALKLHILAQNMGEGKIEKGVIANFIGIKHINMIGFYIKYPQEAVKIVLRTLNNVLAGEYGERLSLNDIRKGKNKKENIELAMGSLDKPNWQKVIGEIGRMDAGYVQNGELKFSDILSWNKIFKGLNVGIARKLTDDKYIQKQIDNINNKK